MSIEPAWISDVLAVGIHERLIEEFGGNTGIRDKGLLESALAAPQNRFTYGEADFINLAACYAHSINRNHPFIDGNKRVGFMLAVVFLELNGYEVFADEISTVKMTLGLAAREITEEGYAEWLRKNSQKSK